MSLTIKPKAKGKKAAGIQFIQKIIKGDTFLVLSDPKLEIEDEFTGEYFRQNETGKQFLLPPFLPRTLQDLTYKNNALAQCVEAMEVNIDGTGYELVADDDQKKPDEAEVERLRGFFEEPVPGQNFVSIRRQLRRDLEQVGWAALEIIENVAGDVVGCRNVVTASLRLVKLDEAVQVSHKLERNGKEVEITMFDRERRYAQSVGTGAASTRKYLYFRDFGATRHLHRDTGDWDSPEKPVKPEDRASRLLFFGVHPDVGTPYYLPRWINNLPAVVGSRKAEEENLQFFDAGGMPPAIIFISGGTLATDASTQLKQYLSGMNKNRHRGVVVEVASTSGEIDKSQPVNVSVERFGGEGKQDPMFSDYDEASAEKVRMAFRLPQLFLGKMTDMSLASAVTAYMVAEAQVFKPEREEFDAIMNRTLMRALKAKGVKFHSLPMTLSNVDARLRALALSGPYVSGESYVDELNKTAGTSLEHVPSRLIGQGMSISPIPDADGPLDSIQEMLDQADARAAAMADLIAGGATDPNANVQNHSDAGKTPAKPSGAASQGTADAQAGKEPKSKGMRTLIRLADLYAQFYGIIPRRQEFHPDIAHKLERAVVGLDAHNSKVFNQLIARIATESENIREPEHHH